MVEKEISVEFDLVNWCTLRCVGCQSVTKKHAVNLDFDLAMSKIDSKNIKQIILCGDVGEPTLHPDITSIIIKCFDITNRVYISTNAELFRYLDLKKILKYKENIFFEISVDGHINEIHRMTRRGGDLGRVMNNADELIIAGFNVNFVYTRHKLNENFVKEAHQMIYDNFGVELEFRDTNEVGDLVSPPTHKSVNSDASILYREKLPDNKDLLMRIYNVEPDDSYKYVRNDGEIFPCYAFCETEVELTEGLDFDRLCGWYQDNGDIRRCILNCGIYHSSDFRYDNINEVSGGGDE